MSKSDRSVARAHRRPAVAWVAHEGASMTVRIDNPVALRVVPRANAARIGTVLTSFGGLVLLCYGLYIAAWLVNTLVMTLMLALVVSPILFGLRRRGWPAWAAVLGAFLVVFGITMA